MKQIYPIINKSRLFLLFYVVASLFAGNSAHAQFGTINTVAGNGTAAFAGDGGSATNASLNTPLGILVDPAGNLYIADQQNNKIRKVTASTGIISTYAGNGTAGYAGDGGPAISAELQHPSGIYMDAGGNLYIGDLLNNRVRKVDAAGIITTVAGNGTGGFAGDGGPATAAEMNQPYGVWVDAAGNLLITDQGNLRVREVTGATGIINTIAGTGAGAFCCDGSPATSASFSTPAGICKDAGGTVYFSTQAGDARVRKIDPAGIIHTEEGTGTTGFTGDCGPATVAEVFWPQGLALDAAGNVYLATSSDYRIREVISSTGIIHTVAGSGGTVFSGDGGPALSAGMNPYGVFVDAANNIYISGDNRVRKVTLAENRDTVSFCNGGSAVLGSATTYATSVLWSTGATTPSITVTTGGIYWVQLSICTYITTDTFVVQDITPVVNLGPDTSLCGGTAITLHSSVPYTGPTTYLWNTGSTAPSISVSTPGTYWLNVITNGCSARDSINVGAGVPVHLGPDTSICIGNSVSLHSSDSYTAPAYLWSTGSTTPSITVSATGTYWLRVNLGSCTGIDTVHVYVAPLPVVTATSNAPLCSTSVDTLRLSVTPDSAGETFSWLGPAAYTTTGEFPTRTPFGAVQAGIYTVTATSSYGCKSATTTDAELIPPPLAPVIHGDTLYCQGSSFVPFVVTDASGTTLDSGLLWYLVATGGLSTTTPLTINTSVPGYYTVWVSRKLGSCEGPRGSISVRVRETPPAPLVTGTMQYCQHIGPFVPVTVHTAAGGTANWYTTATGGMPSATEPTPNINVAGVNSYWVSQTDSGCEGPRQPVTITIHPQPAPPVVHPQPWCQFRTPSPVSATPSETGDNLLWYGPGIIAGTSTAPTPGTSTAPDTINYYVTETSAFGCVSDSALDKEIIIKKPAAPITTDISYCQYARAVALNAQVDSTANSNLNWYFNGTLLPAAPVPPTDTTPGSATWYVTQTVNTCESDSASVTVTILYKPVFGITPGQPWVCQFDSISLKYSGPVLVAPGYTWTLPEGAAFASGTLGNEDSVIVVFDSAVQYNYVGLTVSDYGGTCSSDTTIRIKIVTQPTAQVFTKADVCLGDTVDLALTTISEDATNYEWDIDNTALLSSPAISAIQVNSNSGGPFTISWLDSGRHVIEVWSYSEEGCKSAPAFDSVNVHTIPDAHFKISSETQSGCISDTVQFSADVADYNDLYVWSPAHSFENVNTPVAWGKIEEANTIITLTVTDPFGCVATENMEIDPSSCCTVSFPNAFTPNGDTKNDFFRPIYTGGYHKFHTFLIVNRWGQTVFSSENSGMQWDGNYNGVPQDMGTYFYYIKYDCGGKTIEQKGDVTLIR